MNATTNTQLTSAGGRLVLSRRAARTCEQPVSYLMALALSRPHLISLAAGFVDQQSLPVAETEQSLRELLSDGEAARAALQYGTTQGLPRLRELVVEHLAALDRCQPGQLGITIDNVLITTGSQQLLQLLSDVLLDPGDIVLVGAPDYFVYMGTLVSLGARLVGVAMDQGGLVPEALEETLEHLDRAGDLRRVKLLYCCSYCQNPTGVTLLEERRPQVIDIVQRWSRYQRIVVLEDAAYRELNYYGQAPHSLRFFDSTGQTVVLTQTFSKAFSPGIRIGYSVLPPELLGPVLHLKGTHDFGSSNFNQHLLAGVLGSGRYAEHVRELRSVYRAKLEAMLGALEKAFAPMPVQAHWTEPQGGLYVWLALPDGIDTSRDGKLFQRCLEKGVLYVPGQYCYPDRLGPGVSAALGGPTSTMRLSFGVQPVERIREGISRLAQAVQDGLNDG